MANFQIWRDPHPMCRMLSLLLAAASFATAAAAQTWPSRPVRIIVPQAAGGMPDIVARVISGPLSQALGQQVLIENRAGDGTPGAQAVARAAPDGYTYLLAPTSLLVINQYTAKIVPYKGVQDTIAGSTHLSVQGIPAIAPAVQGGQLRGLAVSSPRRLPELPDVATLSETFPDFEFNVWLAVVAPAGAPGSAIRRMNLELNRVLLDGGVEQRLRALGLYTEGSGPPEEVDAFLKSERESWSRVVRELKVEPE